MAAPRFPPSTSGGSGLHRSRILKAARDGDLRLLKELARALDEGEGRVAEKLGAVRGSKGVGVLHFAAISGSLAMCQYLVEDLGFDVDALSHKHETPLTFAITRGNLDLVRYFLGQGADIERPNTKGWTPLYLAATDAKPEIVELLLSKGANVDSLSGGATALHVAASGGQDDVVKTLLDHHADQAEFEALEAMKHGNWLTAAQSFTKAIDLYHNVYLIANRSLCWLILGDAEKALMDAQVCRTMRPGWAEAYNRQGHALMLLEDYEKACDAYLDGLKLEPGNARFEKDLRNALESLKTSGST